MTDASLPAAEPENRRHSVSLTAPDARTQRRNAAEKRFRAYGIAGIATGLFFLVVLLVSIVGSGIGAFQQTFISVPVYLDPEKLDKNGNRNIDDIKKVSTFGYTPLIQQAVFDKVQENGIETPLEKRGDMKALISASAAAQARDMVIANPDLIGETIDMRLLASSRVDGYLKGRVKREDVARDKNIDSEHLDLVDALVPLGVVQKTFNIDFITGADASESRAEAAGIGVSMLGSFFMMLVVLALALPIGVAASIYLEEFAPKNRWTDLIEVNIANLAAVPSIVFGILGSRCVHPVHAPATVSAAGWWSCADIDDAADDHHLDARLAQSRAAVYPGCGAWGRGLENAGGVPPRAAPRRAWDPDRDHHRSGAGAWRNGAALADRYGRLHCVEPTKRCGQRVDGSELGHACTNLRMGQTGGSRLLRTRLGRDHHPADFLDHHEYNRRHSSSSI